MWAVSMLANEGSQRFAPPSWTSFASRRAKYHGPGFETRLRFAIFRHRQDERCRLT
jgi:hypothetical protein